MRPQMNYSDHALDWKKYCYAHGVDRLNRIHDIGRTFRAHVDVEELVEKNPASDAVDDLQWIHENLGAMELTLYWATFFDPDATHDYRRYPDYGERGVRYSDLDDEEFLNHYSDGRLVSTTLRWENGWHTHIFNPDPRHPDDRPGRVYRIEAYSGFRENSPRRIIVTASGVVDVFSSSKRPGLFDEDDDTCEGNVG